MFKDSLQDKDCDSEDFPHDKESSSEKKRLRPKLDLTPQIQLESL